MATYRRAEWGSARGKLLQAAQDILLEEFTGDRCRGDAIASAFAFLDPAAIAKRAGVARSAFYHHWGEPVEGESDGLTPFQRFANEVFEADWGHPVDMSLVNILAAHKGSFGTLVRNLARVESQRYDEDLPWSKWRASVAVATFGGAPPTSIDDIFSVVAEFYDVILDRFGRRVRPPLTSFDVAAMMVAFLDGLWLRRANGAADPNPTYDWADPDTGEIEPWSLAEIGINALAMATSEPVPNR